MARSTSEEGDMATLQQAKNAFDNARAFFSARDGALKSTNKAYMDQAGNEGQEVARTLADAKGISEQDALAQIQRRAAARLQAKGLGKYEAHQVGLTPVGYGKLNVQRGSRTGNCGVMACVAMHYASLEGVPDNEMWLVTVTNPSTKRKGTKARLGFGHSYALLGAGRGQEFIVDPWAGIYCAKNEYEKAMKTRMKRWHEQGKRIAVNWGDGVTEWANATDKSVLSLLNSKAQDDSMRGDARF